MCSFEDEASNMREDAIMTPLEPEKTLSKLGILANYSVERETGEVKVFINLFKTRNPHISSTAWVSLSTVKVYADISLGLVSQQWLETFSTHDVDTITKLRQLQMLSWQESQSEKTSSLRHTRGDKESKPDSEKMTFTSEKV